jgi:predicted ATPase/class 3 adenylate cyclase
VTFLFTDIESSTARWEQDRGAMSEALRVHDTISADVVREGGGVVFKTTGDGVCAAFDDARAGVETALKIRDRLAKESWPASIGPLLVRMAVHTGHAELRDDDYFGPTLSRVSRIMSAAHGGQILVSAATRQMLLDGDFHFQDLGQHRLRDLLQPEHLYQVGEPNEHHPPLVTLDAHNHNLPGQVTEFIGREQELEDILDLIPTSPLVTLTGPGGTGKTRLALQAAAELIEMFDGVFFVPLAAVVNPEDLGLAIAEAVGLQIQSAEDPEAALATHLATRRYLLVLDNFEQLVTAAPLIGSLLSAGPDLRVLVTSRELLRLRAERNYPVAPLRVPAVTRDLPLTELARVEAIRLFEERATAVRPDFELDQSNIEDVAEICRRLDGLPLAIELAAARARVFAPHQLRAALERDLGALGTGPRDAPRRHQTLVETITWSYDLLGDVEQVIFRRLGAFVGGCSLEAMESVCLPDLSIDAMTAVEELADRSLIRVADGSGGRPRVAMLETIRAFTRLELEASGEMADVLGRHASYFADLTELAEPELRGRDQEKWIRWLDEERPNLEAALAWSFSSGDPIQGLRLVANLRDYWFYQGHYPVMARWADEARARLAGQEAALQAGVLLTAGFHAFGTYGDEAPAFLAQAADLYEKAGDAAHRALALVFEAGSADVISGDLESAAEALQKGIALARDAGARNVLAQALNLWGELERRMGNYVRSREIQEQSLEIATEIGEQRRVAMVLHNLGLIAHHLDDDATAKTLIRQSLELSAKIGFDANVAHCLIAIAEQIALDGDPARGARLIGAADAHFSRIGLIAQPADAPDFDRIRTDIRMRLGDEEYESELSQGAKLTLDQAVVVATETSRQ